MKTSGMDTQHHIAATIRTSMNGADPEDLKKKSTILKKRNMKKQRPGNSVAVKMVQSCHDLPRKALYKRLLTYPASDPNNM
mmetsp:Transcript_16063/g.22876  ORF Transcript_16063/g.22876 Transcript_16063/m.22876 type:complete len:81 (-) Transcript_16063:1333-1575(-)